MLLKAGIHPNPGPTPVIYNCPICQKNVTSRHTSVKCSKCLLWCHLRKNNNCSNLKSYREYKPDYKCSKCLNQSPSSQPNPQINPPPTPVPVPASQPTLPASPQLSLPVPTIQKEKEKFKLKILQFNCNGLRNKVTELIPWLTQNEVKIAALQETKLNSKSKDPFTADFTLVRKDRNKDKGGGLAFLIHKTIQFKVLPDPP